MKVSLSNSDLLDTDIVNTWSNNVFSNFEGEICRKPLVRENPLNRRNWSEYRECLKRQEKKSAREALAIEREREFELEKLKTQSQQSALESLLREEPKKEFPIGLVVGLSVVALGAIGFIIYKTIKK